MADHLDAPGLMPPGGDPSIDITDVYAFQKPGDSNKSILILNVNPLTLAPSFRNDALYELKVDTDGDLLANVSFRMTFSPFSSFGQQATVRIASGTDAISAPIGLEVAGVRIFENIPVSFGATSTFATSGDYKFFAGIRSDPFFFDLAGFLNNLQFTGTDFFVDKNVFGIALEVPNSLFGSNPNLGIWARVLIPENGERWVQKDRMGRPAINTVFMKGNRKNDFNRDEPYADRAQFTNEVVAVLAHFGYSEDQAKAIANIILPDMLTYDYNNPAGFLNGRKLTDDVIDLELGLVTNGKVTADRVGSHLDLLPFFPYMGTPHPT